MSARNDVLDGVRVVEISSYAFAATAAAVLADWGAEVVRVLRPGVPDPFLRNPVGGMDEDGVDVAYMWEIVNRGKRAIELDISRPEGAAVFARLIERADVFITNTLPPVRRKLGIDVDALREVNPDLIYARASATGPAGPEAELGGFDTSAFWARSGFAHVSAALSGEHGPPGIAIGDLSSGVNLAAGISAALYRRLRTGQPSVVDASLLATGAWLASPHIVAASVYDVESLPIAPHSHSRNPLVAVYRTRDGRYLSVAAIAGDAGWLVLCGAAQRPDLAGDPRFALLEDRRRHHVECVAVLDEVFAAHTLETWLERLGPTALAVAEVRPPRAVAADPQVRANGYVGQTTSPSGRPYNVVSTPVQFDEAPIPPARAPRPGQHTDEVLAELGYTAEQIAALRSDSLIGS